MKTRIAFVVVAVALAFALTGCEPTNVIPTPSASDVVGTWRHGSDTLRIDADGSFALTGVPLGVIEQRPAAADGTARGPAESVSGTWSIGSGGTDVGGAPGVQLDFVKPRKVGFDYGLTLVVSHDSPALLYVFLGRPDSDIRYSFTKSR